MQSSAGAKCKVLDLKEANKVLEYAIETSDRGITFKAGAIDWDNMVMACISDASLAQENEEMPALIEAGAKEGEKYRSQGGRLNCLATPSLLEANDGHLHIISFGSTKCKRVCRATFQAETYALSNAVEWGDFLRAAIADLFGKLNITRWYESSCAALRQVWFTDCNSNKEAMLNPNGQKYSDKRMNIEIAALRQILWRAPGSASGLPHVEDERPNDATDVVRWIDTDVMLADPLTKVMEPDKLVAAMQTGYWDIEQPIESVMKKRAKQAARSRKKLQDADDVVNVEEDGYTTEEPMAGINISYVHCRIHTPDGGQTDEEWDNDYVDEWEWSPIAIL